MVAMHIGRPLLGQRVEDLLAALRFIVDRPEVNVGSVHLVAVGRAGPIALHAAAIEPNFASVTLRSTIHSWSADVVARPARAAIDRARRARCAPALRFAGFGGDAGRQVDRGNRRLILGRRDLW